jgi:type II secretory pathway pseudopilin PulG
MASKQRGRLEESAGYTFVEAMTVVAVMGAIAAYSAPSIMHFKAAQEVQSATSQVGGMLQRVRARAASEATPYLVLFQKEEVGDGERSAFALIVRDNDRSYSLTGPDDVETFKLDPRLRPEVRQYGEALAAPIYETMLAPVADRSTAVAVDGGGSSSGNSGEGSGTSGSTDRVSSTTSALLSTARETVKDAVKNGTTFEVSDKEGVPAIAFNERGIPVSLDAPQDWGSGAGAVYLTDNANAVYAAVLSPLGEVSTSRYDAATGTWKK